MKKIGGKSSITKAKAKAKKNMGLIQEAVDELHQSLLECNEMYMINSEKQGENSLTSDITQTTSSETTSGSSSNCYQQNNDYTEKPLLSTGYERRRSFRRIDRSIKNLESTLHEETIKNENPIVLDDGITHDLIMAVTHVPSFLQQHEQESNHSFSFYESTCEIASRIILDYCCLPFQNAQYIDALLDRCATLCIGSTGCCAKLYPILSILNANLFHHDQQNQNQQHHDEDGNNNDNDTNDNGGITTNCYKKMFASLTIHESMNLLEVMVPISLIDFHKKCWKPPDNNNRMDDENKTGPIHLRLFLSFLIRYLFSAFLNHDKNIKDDDGNGHRFQSLLTNHLHPFLIELIEYSLDVIEGSSSYLKSKATATTSNHVQLVIQDVIQHVSLTIEFIHISQPWVTVQRDIIISLWTSFTNYIASFSSHIDHNSYQDSEENISIVSDDLLLRLLKFVLLPLQHHDQQALSFQHNKSFKTTLIMSFLRLLTTQQQQQHEHHNDLLTRALLSCTSSDSDEEWIHLLQSAILSTMVLPTMNNTIDDPTSSFSQVNHLVQILLVFLQRQQKNQQDINQHIKQEEETEQALQQPRIQDSTTVLDPWHYLVIEKMVEINNISNNGNTTHHDNDDENHNDAKKNQTKNCVKQYIDFVLPQKQLPQTELPQNEERVSMEENDTQTTNSSSRNDFR